MSQQFSGRIQVNSGHYEVACKCVAHVVPAEIFYFCSFKDRIPGFADVIQNTFALWITVDLF